MKVIGICLALGHIYQNRGKGELVRPLDGAIARFDRVTKRAAEIYSLDKKGTLNLICTAGYSKAHPYCAERPGEVSLAGQLDRFVNDHARKWKKFLRAEPLCWSTRNEIHEGIQLALRERHAKKDEAAVLLIASNWAHLPRVWLYAQLYKPKAWKLELLVAHHSFSLRDYLLEIAKIGRELWHCTIGTYRHTKTQNV